MQNHKNKLKEMACPLNAKFIERFISKRVTDY
jgi:hypothetical protein